MIHKAAPLDDTTSNDRGGANEDRTRPAQGSAEELAPGTLVGDFCIEARIGEGGMGTVYSASHPVIGKRVAIKVIRRVLCADYTCVERFIREARVLSALQHPNIVEIHSFGALADGRRYFVMELLAGESLDVSIKRRRLSCEEALAVMRPVVSALSSAHAHGVVHRDIKPANIFLATHPTGPPVVKLMDFGIAKLASADNELTQAGVLLGTPAYVSAEQARGEAVDHRSDLYSIGVMLFELLTGQRPFEGANGLLLLQKHAEEAPPRVRTFLPKVSVELDALVDRLLAKDPAARPALPELEALLAPASRTTGVRPRWVAGFGLGVGAGFIVLGVIAHPASWRPRPAAAGLRPPIASPVGAANGNATLLTSAPALATAGSAPPTALSPAPSVAAKLPAVFEVTANVASARFEIDSQTVANAVHSIRVPLTADAMHEVTVSAPGYRPLVQQVSGAPGAHLFFTATLIADRPAVRGHREPPAPDRRTLKWPF